MTRNLSRGMTGQDVRFLQDRLNYHLRRETPLVRDGIFGPLTHARVVKFQTLHGLRGDGIFGPLTKAVVYRIDETTAQVLVVPNLTLPPLGVRSGGFGIQPPRLIPPLQLPGFLPPPQPQAPNLLLQPPILFGPQLRLNGVSAAAFSPVNQPSLFNLTFTAAPVQDPQDPVVQSTRNLVKLIEQVPVDSKFKAMVISMIPNPVPKIGEPKPGLDIDIGPPKFSPLDPTKITQSGGAKYTLRLTGKPGGSTPQIFLQGRAEGEVEINYEGRARSTYFTAKAEGNFFLGFIGVF